MAGRGRAATLPAWMTAPAPPGGGAGAPPGPPSRVAPAPPAPPRRWTEHRAPDGRPYWNDGTRSTYAKPQELMTPMERADASTRWREHRAPDGRTYYYHQDTRETRWSLPDDLRLAREAAALAQTAIAAAAAARSSSPAPPPPPAAAAAASTGPSTGSPKARVPRPRDPNAPPRVYADREEAKAAFKELLEDYEIRAGAKWDETAKQIAADERFGALKTIGDKKQCFNEYQTQRAKHEREAKRAAEKAARANFTAMLDERWREFGVEDPSLARHRPRLQDHVDAIAGAEDPRWSAVKDPRDREDLFRSFCDALRIKLRDEKKKLRDEKVNAFKATLRAMGVDSVVDWTWRRVLDELAKDVETTNPDKDGDGGIRTLDRSIQLEAYEEYANELERAHAQLAREEKAARLREERRRRDAFVRSLKRARHRGSLRLRMPWRTFVERFLENDAAFVELSRNLSGSRARELYDDEQEEMELLAAEDRAAVEAAAAKAGFEIIANETTRDALMAAVRGKASLPARVTGETGGDEARDGEIDGAQPRRVDSKEEVEEEEEERLRVACGDAVVAAKERARRAARRKERALDDFYYLLRSRRRDVPITPSSTWADVEPALAGERAWIKCVGQPASGGGGDDGPVEGKGGNDPSNVKEKPKETYRADAEAVFVKYVEKLRRREAQAREAMEDGEAMDEGVYDAQDDEDVAVELRRRKERDDLSDELDARGGKRDRRR